MKLFKDNTIVPVGSIGWKIKKYRELRGLTQKQLGMLCGFPEGSADVRIAQYEKNKKIPRDNALKLLTQALDIDEDALNNGAFQRNSRMYHVLFDLEDQHGLHPVRKEDGYYLEFSKHMDASSNGYSPLEFQNFLEIWYQKRQKYNPEKTDSPEEKEAKAREYALWKGGYPGNEADKAFQEMQDAERERRLQAELDALYAKRKSESEMERIDSAIEEFLPNVRKVLSSMTSAEELFSVIKASEKKGLPMESFSPEVKLEDDPDHGHLFTIKTEDITKDTDSRKLYTRIVVAVELLQKQGIQISRRIISRDKVLYVTYEFPWEQDDFLGAFNKVWDDDQRR